MLTEKGVGQISLRELSDRVGLAKSNVLRYFDSREAIFLELLDEECLSWLEGDHAGFSLDPTGNPRPAAEWRHVDEQTPRAAPGERHPPGGPVGKIVRRDSYNG